MNEQKAPGGWDALSGIAFVALAVAAAIVFQPVDPSKGDAAILAHYASTSAKAREWIGGALILLAVPPLLWFVSALRSRLGGGRYGNLAFAGGALTATFALAGFALMMSPTVAASWATDAFHAQPNTIRVILFAGQFLVMGGAAAGGFVLVLATSPAARRTGVLPHWLVVGGYAVAPLVLLAVPLYGITLALLLAWIVAASASLAGAGRPGRAATPAVAR